MIAGYINAKSNGQLFIMQKGNKILKVLGDGIRKTLKQLTGAQGKKNENPKPTYHGLLHRIQDHIFRMIPVGLVSVLILS
jgi:hypothetical protein